MRSALELMMKRNIHEENLVEKCENAAATLSTALSESLPALTQINELQTQFGASLQSFNSFIDNNQTLIEATRQHLEEITERNSKVWNDLNLSADWVHNLRNGIEENHNILQNFLKKWESHTSAGLSDYALNLSTAAKQRVKAVDHELISASEDFVSGVKNLEGVVENLKHTIESSKARKRFFFFKDN